jgi:uncharacterized tellurite resistance protein B-like protein
VDATQLASSGADGSMPAPFYWTPDAAMSLKDWITKYLPGGAGQGAGGPAEMGTSLAVAALLVEVLRADYEVGPVERQQAMASVAALLGLQPEATRALLDEAERHIDKSHDLYQFTSQINRSYSEADKVRLLEALWRVADADLAIHKYEEHLIRRVADLLHVPHSGFIAAKLRATGPAAQG